MCHHPVNRFSRRHQSGIALIEALVSMFVLAIGILGLMGAQMRSLVDTRIANQRGLVIRQIDDLNERIWLNRTPALAAAYAINDFADPDANAPANCDSGLDANRVAETAITVTDMAACDVWRWRTALAATIPGARAQVLRIDATNQYRVIVAWPANEKGVGDAAGAVAASMDVKNASDGTTLCPDKYICHIQFIEI